MPVIFHFQDVNHVAHHHLVFLMLVGNDTSTGSYHQNLVAGVLVPSGGGPKFKVYYATACLLYTSDAADE